MQGTPQSHLEKSAEVEMQFLEMEKKIETTIMGYIGIYGLYWNNGKQNGNYWLTSDYLTNTAETMIPGCSFYNNRTQDGPLENSIEPFQHRGIHQAP